MGEGGLTEVGIIEVLPIIGTSEVDSAGASLALSSLVPRLNRKGNKAPSAMNGPLSVRSKGLRKVPLLACDWQVSGMPSSPVAGWQPPAQLTGGRTETFRGAWILRATSRARMKGWNLHSVLRHARPTGWFLPSLPGMVSVRSAQLRRRQRSTRPKRKPKKIRPMRLMPRMKPIL